VVRPAEFKKDVAQIRKAVRLRKRNRLTVALTGKPGSLLYRHPSLRNPE
jgi:hypothetical protein